MTTAGTLIDAVWDSHAVSQDDDGADLVYIDLHLVHEASSPQAFDGLRLAGRGVRRPDLTLAIEDHNVPTDTLLVRDPLGRAQLEQLRANCELHGIENLRHGEARQGIVHVVAPELGLVQPGMTLICGDSHTSTHGAFGAIALGVGTSDVEHVLATQTLPLRRPRTMAVEFTGVLPVGVTAKDMALALIAKIGANGAHGYMIEYRGAPVESLSMESRMTLCNMSIEAGARAGLIAPDQVTFDYLHERPCAPHGADWDSAVEYWRSLKSAAGPAFDRVVTLDVSGLTPFVIWGTHPGQAVPLSGRVPSPQDFAGPVVAASFGDIFLRNAWKNGLMAVTLPADGVEWLAARVEDYGQLQVVIDLRSRRLEAGGRSYRFDVDERARRLLLSGRDDISETLQAHVTIAFAATMLCLGFSETLGLQIVTVGLHHAPTWLGVLVTIQGAGALAGGFTAGLVARKIGDTRLTACGMTTFQKVTPPDLIGRAMGAADLAIQTPQAAGIGVGAYLVAVLDYRVICCLIAAILGLTAVFLATRPARSAERVRHAERPEPVIA